MTTSPATPGPQPVSRGRVLGFALAGALAGLMAGAAVLYVNGRGDGNAAATAKDCAATAATLALLKPLAKGDVAGVAVPDAPRAVPKLAFKDKDGKPLQLADFRGKTVLLNLWATWCAPCREEMPALDKLQAELGGDAFQVVAVSVDTQDEARTKEFFASLNLKTLPYYADTSRAVFQDMKMAGRATGLPSTLILDKTGCEVGYLPGPADWASADAKALVRAAMGIGG